VSKGLGLLTSEALPVGLEVDLGLVTNEEILVAPATIRHCKEYAPGSFRSGAFMHLFGRVEQARWRKIMHLYFRGSASAVVRAAA
jgi:predicted component of type VI protein secretion system